MAIDRIVRSPKRLSLVAAGLLTAAAGGARASELGTRPAKVDSVSTSGAGGGSGTKERAGAGKQAKVYTCPMHPEVISDKPGNCPKCGMTLVLKHPAAPPPTEDKK